MTPIEKQLSQAIDAVYAALAQTEDDKIMNHLANALDSLISALHGEEDEDEAF